MTELRILTDDDVALLHSAAERLILIESRTTPPLPPGDDRDELLDARLDYTLACSNPVVILAITEEVQAARSRSTALEATQPLRDEVFPETIVHMHLDGKSRKYIPVDGVELKEIVDAAVFARRHQPGTEHPEDGHQPDECPTGECVWALVHERDHLRAEVVRYEQAATGTDWEDKPLPEDEAIKAAFPTRSGHHGAYGEAMRLVGARQSKGALVSLVNWLLVRIAKLSER